MALPCRAEGYWAGCRHSPCLFVPRGTFCATPRPIWFGMGPRPSHCFTTPERALTRRRVPQPRQPRLSGLGDGSERVRQDPRSLLGQASCHFAPTTWRAHGRRLGKTSCSRSAGWDLAPPLLHRLHPLWFVILPLTWWPVAIRLRTDPNEDSGDDLATHPPKSRVPA